MGERDESSESPATARSLITVSSSVDTSRAPLFPSDPDVPRRRRPSDVTQIVPAGIAFVLLGWLASREPELDGRVLELVADLPSWLSTLSWVAYTTSAVASLLLLAAAVASGNERASVVRDLICALGVAIVLAVIAARLATGAWPHLLPEVVDAGDRPAFPTLRPTLVVITVLVLGPYVNATVQRWMRLMILSVIVAPLLLGLTTVTAIFGSLVLSLFGVTAVRLAFGSPEGLPTLDRLHASLEQGGISVSDLRYRAEQPGTVGLATATSADGRPLDIKIYGVDAASRQRAERVWRNLWYRRAGPSARAGRIEQAQHEALAVLSARDAGVNVPALVGSGQAPSGDVLLVSVAPRGTPLGELDEPTGAQLSALWSELADLHGRARIAHGSIHPTTVGLHGGDAVLFDLERSSLFPTEQQLSADLVSMLGSQALVVGAERAVDAALGQVDRDTLIAALPYMQEAVLDPALRRDLKAAGITTKDLGGRVAERLDVEHPDPAPVRRVTLQDIAIAIGAIIAGNALITQIADIGFSTLIDELTNASAGWLIAAFLINLTAYATAYIGLSAVVDQPLPFSPTAMLQSAKSFVGLVVPSMVGRVGLDIRFLQNQGVSLAVASTQGPVIGFIGFVAEVTLLVLGAWAIGQEIETDQLADIDAGGLLGIAVIVVAIGIVVVLAVPKLRNTILPFVRDAIGTVRVVVTSPRTLARIYTSEMLDRLIKALALGATVVAFGANLPFPALVFVSVGTGLLAGLAPVPGGIGVAEATMSGLLTATGLPAEQAVSIAIVHRLVTAYLPPVIGFFSFNWLTEEGYL